MNELITVNYENNRPTVSARELHDFLGVSTKYPDWFPRMCEYGFSEGEDFNLLKNERVQNEGGRMVTRIVDDAQLTIDMAKEICMLQRNEKGKQARQYFIQLEKDWNSPEKVMARALQIADQQIKQLTEKNKTLELQNDEMKPKALFADAVTTSDDTILIGELAKIIRQNGVNIGQNRLFQWLRKEGYLIKGGKAKNMPTQKAVDMGLFKIKERTINNPDGSVRMTKTTLVTGKGQVYFINKFLKKQD